MGVGRLICAAGIALAALSTLCAIPCGPHAARCGPMMGVTDRCVVDYPQFLELMMDGEVVVTDGDLTVRLVKSECGWHYLQRLSILVKAE